MQERNSWKKKKECDLNSLRRFALLSQRQSSPWTQLERRTDEQRDGRGPLFCQFLARIWVTPPWRASLRTGVASAAASCDGWGGRRRLP